MAITIDEAQTGFGISATIGTYRWNGHGFNPTNNKTDGYQTFDPFNDSWAGATTLNPTAAFDLLGYQYGNEVVVFFLKYTSTISQGVTTTMQFIDPDDNVIYQKEFTPYIYADDWAGSWIGIGIKEYPTNEIWKNGTYRAAYSIVHSGGTISGSINFVVSNYPTTTASTNVGAVWVEGENLAYICAQRRKIAVKNDGTSSFVSTAKKGSIWLESDGRITYISNTGYKRKTKLGDKYGFNSYGELPNAPGIGYKGHMWACNGFYDVYLMIVSSDGNIYRIGPGYYTTGDYQ